MDTYQFLSEYFTEKWLKQALESREGLSPINSTFKTGIAVL